MIFSLHEWPYRKQTVLNKLHNHEQNNFVLLCGSHARDTADETGLRGFRLRIIQYSCTCFSGTTGDVVVMQLPFHHVRSTANFYQKKIKNDVIFFSPGINHVYDLKEVFPAPNLTCCKLHIWPLSGNLRLLSLPSSFGFKFTSLYQQVFLLLCCGVEFMNYTNK